MATQYDLTPVIAKHLDRHLVFPLLEFLGGRGVYDAADIEAAKLALIEKTNMVDYAVDIYQQLNQTDEVGAAGAAAAAGTTGSCLGLPRPVHRLAWCCPGCRQVRTGGQAAARPATWAPAPVGPAPGHGLLCVLCRAAALACPLLGCSRLLWPQDACMQLCQQLQHTRSP